MPNHPHRNWRTRMHAACAVWLMRWRWPEGTGLLTPEQLHDLMRQAYLAGYEERHQRPPRTPRTPT